MEYNSFMGKKVDQQSTENMERGFKNFFLGGGLGKLQGGPRLLFWIIVVFILLAIVVSFITSL